MSSLNTDEKMEVLQSFITDPITNAGQTLAYMKTQPMSVMAQLPMSPAMNFLASTSYPQPLPQTPHHHFSSKTHAQLFGGMVAQPLDDNDDSGTSTDADPISNHKKKVRGFSNASVDDATADSKRQRGRPRVDTRDETAADRRRTQIRLAQRAYRQRKETTISALKKRVQDLERNIEQISSSFLSFNDQLLDSGLINNRHDLTRRLQVVTEQFVELSKLSTHESDQESESAAQCDLTRETGSGRNSISEPHSRIEMDTNTFGSKRNSMSANIPNYHMLMHGGNSSRIQSVSPQTVQQSLPPQMQQAPIPQRQQRPQEEEMYFSFPGDFPWQNFGSYRSQYDQPVTQSISNSMFTNLDPTVATQSLASRARSTAPP